MRISKRTVAETAAVVAFILSAVVAAPPADSASAPHPGSTVVQR
ncbi:Uncharacterised protein [Nocardia brasiliensis]|nr:Uncharacterised protein [Nocardia brasiliensis]